MIFSYYSQGYIILFSWFVISLNVYSTGDDQRKILNQRLLLFINQKLQQKTIKEKSHMKCEHTCETQESFQWYLIDIHLSLSLYIYIHRRSVWSHISGVISFDSTIFSLPSRGILERNDKRFSRSSNFAVKDIAMYILWSRRDFIVTRTASPMLSKISRST